MSAWFEIGVSNGVAATGLAIVALVATRCCRRPQLAFVLWLLVLLKLVAPPLVAVPLASLRSWAIPEPENAQIEPASTAALPPLPMPMEPFDLPSEIVAEPVAVDGAVPMESPPELAPPELVLEELPQFSIGSEIPLIPVEPTATETPAPAVPARKVLTVKQWIHLLGWSWLAGSLAWFALAAVRMVRFARSLRRAEPAPAALQLEVALLAERLGLSRAPQVRLTRGRIPPLVWAMGGRATMLLPAELLAGLSQPQRATLIAHELVHLARRDYLVRWLELTAIGWYWWHPVAWWARRHLSAAQEQCCDARVLSLLPESARAYAETLLATVEFLAEPSRPLPTGASGFSEFEHLHRRLTMILQPTPSLRVAWPLRASLLAFAVAVLPISLHTLWADPAPPSPDEAAAQKSEPAAEPSPIEQRLERLERMIELLTPKQAAPGTPAAPTTAASAKATDEALEKKNASSHVTNIFNSQTLANLQKQSDLLNDETWRDISRRMYLAEGAHEAVLASARQVEAVRKAYDSGTITADQVLEALRKQFTAGLQYAKYVSELSNDPSQPYMHAVANLVAAEKARRDTKSFWSDLADRGSPRKEVDQAAEQHKLFENYVAGYSRALHDAMKHRVYKSSGREWSLGSQASETIGERTAWADKQTRHLLAEQVATRQRLEAVQKSIDARANQIQSEEKQVLDALETAQRETQTRLTQMRAMREKLAKDNEMLATARKSTEEQIRKVEASLLEIAQRTQVEEKKRTTRELFKAGLPMPAEEKTATEPANKPPAKPEPGKNDSGSLFPKSRNLLLSCHELLEEARKTWQAAHKKYQHSSGAVEAAAEAQAREQYFRFKALAQDNLRFFSTRY